MCSCGICVFLPINIDDVTIVCVHVVFVCFCLSPMFMFLKDNFSLAFLILCYGCSNQLLRPSSGGMERNSILVWCYVDLKVF